MARKNVIIIGGGQAGAQTAWSLRKKGFAGNISIFSADTHLPYQRPPLSKAYLAGELHTDKLYLKPYKFYQDNSIKLNLGVHVEEIDPDAGSVKYFSKSGEMQKFFYDYLVLATGTSPRLFQLDTKILNGIHYLQSIDDVKNIKESLLKAKKAIIIGGGYIGLEVAAVARRLGLEVTVLERSPRIMERVASPLISSYYKEFHQKQSVQIVNDVSVEAIGVGKTVKSVVTSRGDYEADIIIAGIGVNANQKLAENAGLVVGDGVVVDKFCATSSNNIFAAGDCTKHPNAFYNKLIRLESVHNAVEQGKTVAASIMGEDTQYNQVPWFWSDQYNLKLQITGLIDGYDDEVVRGDISENKFSVFYFKRDLMIASYCINSLKDHIAARKIINTKILIDKTKLINTNFALKSCVFS